MTKRQISKSTKHKDLKRLCFIVLNVDIRICFGFRYSRFGFYLNGSFLSGAIQRISRYEGWKWVGTCLEGAPAYPLQARFQVLLGMIAAPENDPEKAIEHNLKALKLEPGNVDAWHNMGLTYLLSDRPKQASAALKRPCPSKNGPIPDASWSRRMRA